MFFLIRALASIAGFLRFAITPVKTTVPPGAAEVAGAMPTQQNVVGSVTDLKNNSAPVFGNFQLGIYAGITNTLLAKDMVAGFIRRAGTQSNADLTDTASNIVAAIPGAVVGQTFPLFIANMNSSVMTLTAGNGVTLTGTATIAQATVRAFMGTVTGSNAVTLTNMFSFPNIGF